MGIKAPLCKLVTHLLLHGGGYAGGLSMERKQAEHVSALQAQGWADWRHVVFRSPPSKEETKLGVTFTVASKPTTVVDLDSSSTSFKPLHIVQHLDLGLGAVVWDCVRAWHARGVGAATCRLTVVMTCYTGP